MEKERRIIMELERLAKELAECAEPAVGLQQVLLDTAVHFLQEVVMSKKLRPFVDRRPCVDEYSDETGLIIKGWMLVGVKLDRGMFGLIFFNQAAGVWLDNDAESHDFFSDAEFYSSMMYLIRLAWFFSLIWWAVRGP